MAKPNYQYTKNDHEEQSELGLYGKVTWRLLEPLAVITGMLITFILLAMVLVTMMRATCGSSVGSTT